MHQAIEFYEQNLRLSREGGDRRGEVAALNSLGRAFAALEEREKAVECYEQALRLARQIGDARGERQTQKNLDEILKPAGAGDKENDRAGRPRRPRQRSKSAKTESGRSKTSQPQSPKEPQAGKK